MPSSSHAVVVSYYDQRSFEPLVSLLRSLKKYPAGLEYGLYLTINGRSESLPRDILDSFDGVFEQENAGYNLGAWQNAWQKIEAQYFLFLQDDCFIRRRYWLKAFDDRYQCLAQPALLGEYLNPNWDSSWQSLLNHKNPETQKRAENYLETLAEIDVPPGDTARHLTAVVQYLSRAALQAVGGYRSFDNYQQAIAAEIAISRQIESLGGQLCQVHGVAHRFVGHPQWRSKDFKGRLRRYFGPTIHK